VPELILASASPRRRELLSLFGLPFRIHTTEIDEAPSSSELPADLVCRLSLAKATAVSKSLTEGVIIAADTVVVWCDQILGKPDSATQAVEMLRNLRQGPHLVLSAVTVLDQTSGRRETRLKRTTVWMRPYTQGEIEAYVASGDPLDKAGSYGIQNRTFRPVARIEGCFAGVMGLPLGDLAAALAEFGVSLERVSERCSGYTSHACCQMTSDKCKMTNDK
jgi:MAF protein